MERPVLNISFQKIDYAIEIATGLVLIYSWIFVVKNFADLPDIVPIHFNQHGLPDDWGSKRTLFLTPFIATGICLLTSWLARRPHILNYTAPIKADNAERQYALATRLMLSIGLIIAILFFYITHENIQIALQNAVSLDKYILPIIIGSFTLILIVYLIAANRR